MSSSKNKSSAVLPPILSLALACSITSAAISSDNIALISALVSALMLPVFATSSLAIIPSMSAFSRAAFSDTFSATSIASFIGSSSFEANSTMLPVVADCSNAASSKIISDSNAALSSLDFCNNSCSIKVVWSATCVLLSVRGVTIGPDWNLVGSLIVPSTVLSYAVSTVDLATVPAVGLIVGSNI